MFIKVGLRVIIINRLKWGEFVNEFKLVDLSHRNGSFKGNVNPDPIVTI